MSKNKKEERFWEFLCSLSDSAGAKAVLRRGLAQEPGTYPPMFRYIEAWVDMKNDYWRGKVYYLVASLWAYHQGFSTEGNMGDHFFSLKGIKREEEDGPTERRFSQLLAAHPDDLLNYHLRQAISLLKSQDINVNWPRLIADLCYWQLPKRTVQHRWASSFWHKNDQSISEKKVS